MEISKDLIARLNELAKLSKKRDLSSEELIEQKNLRETYLREFRAGFENKLKNIKVIDPLGNDITPKKKSS